MYIARPTATHWQEHRPRSLLAAWRESPLYGARRRTALARTEALTRIAQRHAPGEVYADAGDGFSEEELVKLTVAIGLISLCNPLAIGCRYTHPIGTSKAASLLEENHTMRLDWRHSLGPMCFAAVIGAGALHAGFGQTPADAAAGASVTPVFAYDLPSLPGQKMTGVLVEYAPDGSSPPHHHTTKGSVVAFVLEGAIRSKVNDGPVKVYRAGESWLEPPGAAHAVSENASTTEPARLLAVFVAEDGAELTKFDQ